MVDIETASTRNNAAILQIGACTFDELDVFLVSVPLESYELHTEFDISERTVAWWNSQEKAAKDALKLNLRDDINTALSDFMRWLNNCGFTPDRSGLPSIWANPPQFDLTILRSAYHAADMKPPWHYRQERCCRTLWREFPELKVKVNDEGLIKHRADHDAIRQARGMRAMLEKLKS